MASIIPTFEYDIFISYRHNDNLDGWVTGFVQGLEKELKATIKDPLSIYFDENPHDGLLETHDVDGSLKDKLKCLIFIPIISRTYCDPKSFAWNHEFRAFLKIATTDAFGLKVKLPNGNTSSRVLPIRIHELDPNDKNTIETELQGILRAIDFTYKAAGINRPLLPKDDEFNKGTNQYSYRDQINKTANAISDIFAGLQGNTSPSPLERGSVGEVTPTPRISSPKKNWKLDVTEWNKVTGLMFVSIVLFISLLGISVIHFSESPPEIRTYRSTILPPEKTRFISSEGGHVALSPDGRMLAFIASDSIKTPMLWVRPLNSLNARALSRTEGAYLPFWSPDSRFIGFFANGKLKKIDVAGGEPQTLCDAFLGRGGTWNKHGTIVFNDNTNSPLSLVAASGGKKRSLTKLDTVRREISHRWPCFLPDERHFLYLSRKTQTGLHEDDAIFLASLDTTFAPRKIMQASSNIAYANGYILFVQQQTLMAQPFDEQKFQISGEALPIAEHITFTDGPSRGSFSVSENGHLVYQIESGQSGSKFEWLDRSGNSMGSIGQGGKAFPHFRFSPDGERIAVATESDIWLYEIKRKDVRTRFTFNEAIDRTPIWSPDGKTIVFGSNRNGRFELFQRASSGEGNESLLLKSNQSITPSDWSHDGKYIAYYTLQPSDIWVLPLNPSGQDNKQKPFVFLQTEFNESQATFSPDGRWMAYQSDESGREEIYIRPFPGPGVKYKVSITGGTRPRWRIDGKELFFVGTDFRIMSAQISLGNSTVQVGAVKSHAALSYILSASSINRDLYDVTRDGQRFLVEMDQVVAKSIPVTLVVNWLGEINKR